MRKHRLAVFTLSGFLALGAPVALAADKAVSQPVAISPAPVVKARPQVPQFPADVKALGDRLWNAASPAVKAWVKQVAPDIAKGPGDPEALARAAVQARWPNLRVAGAADALTFLADYDAAKTLQADIKRSDSLGDLSQELSLRIKMLQDRYSKFMSLLSDMMKKISDTASGIIANMR